MKKLSIALAGILCMVLLGVSIWMYATQDKEGPVISFSLQDLTYTEGSDTKSLFQGVTAYDTKDGDVSNTLLIESIISLRDNTTAKVIYAAKDLDNHITKNSMIVNYIESQTSVQEDTIPVTEEVTNTAAPTVMVQEAVETIASGTEPIQEGNIKETVGDAALEVNEGTASEVIISDSPIITLTTKEVYITKGSEFDPFEYIASVTDDKDILDTIWRRIMIEGVYNRNKVGTYIIEYFVRDTDGNVSESVYLKLYVTE